MKRELVVVTLLVVGVNANAGYVATGQISGNVCHGFVIQSCRMHLIAGIKGKDGQLYTIKTEFKDVDEFSEEKSRCWIKTKSKGAGWLSLGLNAIQQPIFVTKSESGSYEELDVEYLTFKCAKR